MTILQLMSHLRELGCEIWLDNDRIRLNAPRGALSRELQVELQARREELRAFLKQLTDKAEDDATGGQIVPVSRDGALPLSSAQQRLWVLDQMAPHSALYNIAAALRLEGKLHPEVLRRVFEEVVRRHEVLRATFTAQDGRATQEIQAPSVWTLPLCDLSLLPIDQRQAEVQRLVIQETQRPFDLTTGPLQRTVLLRLEECQHILLVTMHHIASDAWSVGVLIREVATLYPTFLQGKSSPLPELPIQYVDFAHWQLQQLEGKSDTLQGALAYWLAQLAGATTLALPTDRPRPPVQTDHGAQLRFTLPRELHAALNHFSQQQGSTLFMTLLAAFATLLQRYAGQDDICLGTPIANRTRDEVEALIGFFVNTLVLRLDLAGNPRFTELVSRVREVALAAYAHQDVPFQHLVETLAVERDASRTPLFQVMFALQNAPVEKLELPGLRMEPLQVETRTAKFDVTLQLTESAEGLLGELEYNTDLFEESTMCRMAAHLQRLLQGVVADPQQRLAELPMLSSAEQQQVVVAWNATRTDFPRAASVVELFERQVERTPQAVAVSCEGSEWCYAALNEQANRLAHYLCVLGVGPEVRVGLCLERSRDLVVAMLGIVKAGGAYVPLNPSYPQERLQFMIEDAQISILITQQPFTLDVLFEGVRQLRLDEEAEEIAHQPMENPPMRSTATSLAYVMYTSGSTGVPKGIGIEHRAIVRLVCDTDYVQLAVDDVVAQASTASFDAATFEIWGALLNGARLVVIPRDVVLSPPALAEVLLQQRITVLFLTTALFNQVASLRVDAFGTLRHLLFGGQMVDPQWVRRVLETVPPQRLLHVYGPTESTTFASWFHVTAVEAEATTVPIGGPIANTTLYVLDRYGKPVPVGAIGEIYTGGDGVARGYHNRPGLTGENFLPDPFSAVPGARLYRTGDLARWRAGGVLEILGRIDQQVKVRGYRIELGEIEVALRDHPAVRQSAVLAREDHPGDRRLVAYVVPQEGGDLTISMLREHLRAKLPPYMVPAAVVLLETLPLTLNGKVDRDALPAPDASWSDLDKAFVAPRNPEERLLADIWCTVLGLDSVGVHDNFFDLGGDSILSIQIVARATRMGLHLTPRQIFTHQTVAELAEVATPVHGTQAEQGLVMGEVPLTPVQQWFFQQEFEDAHHFNQAVLLQLDPRLDAAMIRCALEAIIAQHDVLRLRFASEFNTWRQWHGEPDATIPFEVVDLSHMSGVAQLRQFEREATRLQSSLSLSQGPLMRVGLFVLGSSRGLRLLLAVHHLVIDGVSWRILLEDLHTACAQQLHGAAIELGPKTTSFRQWAEGLQDYVRGGGVDSEVEFWRALASESMQPLPVDYEGSTNPLGATDTVTVGLDQTRTRALLHEVGKAYRTEINEVLLAALVRTLTHWTGAPLPWLDLEGHGREDLGTDADVSRTVGWFTAVYPVHLHVVASSRPGEVLKAVKEQLRAIPNRGMGYGLLRYLSGDEAVSADMMKLPQPQVAFNYLGQFDQLLPAEALFVPAAEPIGELRSARGRNSHLLAINGMVTNDRLMFDWVFSERCHRRETVATLAEAYVQELTSLIEHCLAPEAGGYTPSDFPLAGLEQAQLDELLDGARDIESLYALSPMQQGLVFHSLYEPESDVYIEQLSFTICGAVDDVAFEQAWQHIVARHAVLRTALLLDGLPRPLQCVHRDVAVFLERYDWRYLSQTEEVEHLTALCAADRARGFQLDQAPLLRLTWIALSGERYRFLLSFHHVLLDGWSLSVLLGEVCRVYASLTSGQRPRLEPVRQYEDFIAWLAQHNPDHAEAFWRSYFTGFSAPTPLVLGRSSTSHSEALAVYPELRFTLSATTTATLQSLAHKHRLTLNTIVQGGWALLLSRYSGERDVVFGVTVSGRPTTLAGVEQMVGLFISTLPLRVLIDTTAPFILWLQRLQEKQLELRSYEATPLVDIHKWSGVALGQPLFESILVFENYPVDAALHDGHLQLAVEDVQGRGRTNYPLAVIVVPEEELCVRLTFDAQRFEPQAMERLLIHLQTLLENIAAHADQCVADLSMLSEAEQHKLLCTWNDTQAAYPTESCVHALWEVQAAQSPEAVAVVLDDGSLSYVALNARANQLAHYLMSWGAGPDVRIGICLERSIDLAVGLLGILKSGSAYVPLDPSYPHERLAFMIEDSGITLLLTQSWLRDRLPVQAASCVCLDADWPLIADLPADNLDSGVVPDNLAYIIYTSGSTGRPKGVAMPHRSLVNLLAWQRLHSQEPGGRTLQFAPMSFDVSFQEFFATWYAGGTLELLSDECRRDFWHLLERLEERRVERIFLPFVALQHLAETVATSGRTLPDGCEIITAGEQLTVTAAIRTLCAQSHCTLENQYGPTECHVVTSYRLATAVEAWPELPPIGRPIANARMYVLDAWWYAVPVGVPGELYIGGVAPARGYLDQPGLTAERFLPDPFSPRPGMRMYRTGDLARYLSDGNIEFLGRMDQQVKVRGFRIEPGEIEAVLTEHPAVWQGVVGAYEDGSGSSRLVAHVVADPAQALTSGTLHAYLEAKLPDYMVPSAFVFLEALPVTPSGKIDRKALPRPELSRPRDAETVGAPRSPVEELLADIWCTVLDLEEVGVHDDFFALGGHSLFATQVISRLRAALRLDIPLRTLFEHPTVAALAAYVTAIQWGGHMLDSPPLVPVPRQDAVPLSWAQQRLWFLDQLEPGSVAYNIPAALRLCGKLDTEVLRRVFEEIVRRHEVLRTTFTGRDGQAMQQIQLPPLWFLPIRELGEIPEARRAAEIQRLAVEEAQKPFDLSQDLPLRTTLVHVAEDEHILLVTMHHIASDGWSVGVLVREVRALYTAFAAGYPSPLPALPIQYGDFAVWQRQWLAGEALQTTLAYWRQQLAGAAVLALPTDRPRPPVQTYRGARLHFALTTKLSHAIEQMSRVQHVTPFMTLLAAFQALLYRYSGQDDICVGTPIANRTQAALETLIGFFVNSLVLRVDLSGNPRFTDLLARVREVALEAYAHQELPFEQLVEALAVERDASRTPLFQVVFALQNAPTDELVLPGLRVAPLPVETDTVKFDLAVGMSACGDGFRGTVEYNTDLLDEATIGRMVDHFMRLLEGAVAEPQRRLMELPLLSEPERLQLLVAWNATVEQFPGNTCIHQLFEAQAVQTPDTIAVIFDNQHLSYAALNARANHVAHHLRTLHVAPEVRVGVFVERSPDLVVGLLAVLKAGGAYVPLDPAYPDERLSFMVQDAGVAVLLTQTPLAGRLATHGVPLVCLDAPQWDTTDRMTSNPTAAATPHNLAYVIYTSGSTGRPKGVGVSHHNLANLCHWHQNVFQVTSRARATQLASVAFDALGWELWPYLTAGACVCLVPAALIAAPEQLCGLLTQEEITHCFVPTPVAEKLFAVPWPQGPALRLLLTGGDRLTQTPAADLPFAVVNNYGPTEATVVATYSADLRRATRPGPPVIGRPIHNTCVYILDDHLQPVPIGVAGELYLSGSGLARGYLDRPLLTAERFLPNPFSSQPGARMYRTGDHVRYLADGSIEFLGRIDEQVNIRGYRIELGEVEAALGEHEAVRQAVVVARTLSTGEQYLVAYVVAEPGTAPSPTIAWHEHLKTTLPDYMIPAAFVLLDEIPLTPNGKVARDVLPVPDAKSMAPLQDYVAPRSPTEELLVAIWSAVLGRERIGVHDDFFALGGHSLLATQVVARLRLAFHLDLPLRALFDASTVAELATRIERAQRSGHHMPLPSLTPARRDEPLALSFGQERLWFLEQLEPGNIAYNIAMALRLRGTLYVQALRQALEEVVRRHEVLRTTYDSSTGQPRQVVQPPMAWELPTVDLSDLAPGEREPALHRLATDQARRPFKLDQDAMLRTGLVRFEDEAQVLLITLHHIAADGWSMGLLCREVAALYAAFIAGKPSPLPELVTQYADFACWQRQWLDGEVLERQLQYWRGRLTGAQALSLPTDRPRPAVQTYRGSQVAFEISAACSAGVRQLSQAQNATPFMILLTVFKILLHRYAGQHDICVGIPIANRLLPELEPLIGFFVNTLVLRTDLSGNPRFVELLAQVRETVLEAYAHQELPLERLVDAIEPRRDLSRSPLFQVMFSLQRMELEVLDLPGLTLAPLQIDNSASRFDLTLDLREGEENIDGCFEYNADLFDETTIRRMAEHFQTLLADIVAAPEQRLGDMRLLTEAEQQRLCVAWNDTRLALPFETCLHRLFEAQVARTPDAPAVIYAGQTLSYADLNARANQLAHHLIGLGVGPETLIGLCAERSLQMVIGLLGILKSGGAYVPLDPDFPAERLAFMITDSGLRYIVTTDEQRHAVAASQARTVVLQQVLHASSAAHAADPTVTVHADHPSYVLYTSGSTGRPKGVVISHRALTNFLWSMQQRPGLGPSDVLLAVTSLSFDIAALELYLPLLLGARVVIAEREGSSDGRRLLELIHNHGVTMLQATPVTWRLLLSAGWQGGENLTALSGGEALAVDLARSIGQRAGSLWNMYGPTETTIWSLVYAVGHTQEDGNGTVLLGRPIGNTTCFVLDTQQRPVPVGVAGELYIGGSGVARGYLHQPALTAERFVPDSFASVPGARMYRTGDLVRYRADGNLEFLGRMDHQVKVRGYRIETGEIEVALRQYAAVSDAVVVARRAFSEPAELVAYVVAEDFLNPTALREHLRTTLPDYMVPSTFVPLQALPLTPNGKVDRQALPVPDDIRAAPAEAYVAPRNPLEEVLVEIWQDVLGIERIGRHDDFFVLGGHSLLATQVISRIRSTFRVQLPLLELFKEPTIVSLAMLLTAHETRHGQVEQVARAWQRLRAMLPEEREKLLREKRNQRDNG